MSEVKQYGLPRGVGPFEFLAKYKHGWYRRIYLKSLDPKEALRLAEVGGHRVESCSFVKWNK